MVVTIILILSFISYHNWSLEIIRDNQLVLLSLVLLEDVLLVAVVILRVRGLAIPCIDLKVQGFLICIWENLYTLFASHLLRLHSSKFKYVSKLFWEILFGLIIMNNGI